MFYTFVPAEERRETVYGNKRRKANRACDHCRLHRVRCSGGRSCSRCIEKDIPCVFSVRSSQQTDRTRHTNASGESRRVGQAARASHSSDSDDTTKSLRGGIDSMLGFTSKINEFFSVVLVHSFPPAWENASPPKFSTPYLQAVPEAETSCESQLSRSQINSLLCIYWRRYHDLAPIFSRAEFEQQLELHWANVAKGQGGSLLFNAVMALCSYYTFHSSLNSQLLGFQGNKPSIAQHYFGRCLESISLATTFGEPTLLHVQSYIIMALYLLGAGQLQAAYNITGMGIRVAHILNLHREPAQSIEADYKEISRRVWWTLVHLDFKSSKRLGKPLGVQLDTVTCILPGQQVNSSTWSSSMTYHDQSVLLTSLSLHVDQAMSKHHVSELENGLAGLENRARVLTEELHRLHNWRENMLKSSTFGKLFLNTDDSPASVIERSEYEAPERMSSQVQQGTLLELQYHDAMNELHRPFIRFARHFSHPERNVLIDAHATTSLRHAMMTIDIVHCRITHYEILRGCSELLQWQWNAVLTLIGFMLAYPLCFLHPEADKRLIMAIEVYESTSSWTFTTRAASIAKNMRERVNGLVALLKDKGGLNHRDLGPQGSTNSVLNDKNSEAHAVGVMENQFLAWEPGTGADDLWSWVEGIDANAWPRYHDEVSSTLADLQAPSRDSQPFAMERGYGETGG